MEVRTMFSSLFVVDSNSCIVLQKFLFNHMHFVVFIGFVRATIAFYARIKSKNVKILVIYVLSVCKNCSSIQSHVILKKTLIEL